MDSIQTLDLKGASGKVYKFRRYPIDSDWISVSAVYIVIRKQKKTDGSYSYKIIYIGQTDDLKARHSSHHKQDCFDKNGATHLCVLIEELEGERLRIERDLINNYQPICNE